MSETLSDSGFDTGQALLDAVDTVSHATALPPQAFPSASQLNAQGRYISQDASQIRVVRE